MIRCCFSNHSREVILPLYKTIVRSLIENSSPAWTPWLQHDINNLYKVQKRCLKLCTDHIKIEHLSTRRQKADMKSPHEGDVQASTRIVQEWATTDSYGYPVCTERAFQEACSKTNPGQKSVHVRTISQIVSSNPGTTWTSTPYLHQISSPSTVQGQTRAGHLDG